MTAPADPPPLATRARKSLAVRLGLVGIIAVLLGGLITFVMLVPPTGSPFYPKCSLNQWTGLHCPGCGLTRSVHALLHGDVLQALAYNALFPLFLPLVVLTVGQSLWRWAWDVPSRLEVKPRWRRKFDKWFPWAFGILVIVFGVVRNLPFEPFTYLAPHVVPSR